jgi:hypothetical protein
VSSRTSLTLFPLISVVLVSMPKCSAIVVTVELALVSLCCCPVPGALTVVQFRYCILSACSCGQPEQCLVLIRFHALAASVHFLTVRVQQHHFHFCLSLFS